MGQVLRGENLTVFGDGSQTRSFQYIDDLVRGIDRLLHTGYHLPVNLGNPDEISILDFAREILELAGNPGLKIVFKPLPENDPKRRCPDISLARKILHWEPRVGRSEGLTRTFEYFKGLSPEELRQTEHKNFDDYIKN